MQTCKNQDLFGKGLNSYCQLEVNFSLICISGLQVYENMWQNLTIPGMHYTKQEIDETNLVDLTSKSYGLMVEWSFEMHKIDI